MVDKFRCIWDFDSPVFAAASIGDKQYVEVTHKKSGRVKEFKNVTEFYGKGKVIGGWLAEQKGDWDKTDFTIKRCTRRNPAISDEKLKKSITSQIKMVESKDFCKELRLVIGGSGNYRYDIYPDYKISRRDLPKPTQLQPLREWLVSEYDVIQEDNIEADDVLGIWAKWGYNKALKSGDYRNNDVCSVFIDKDILQFPGWYYNPKKGSDLVPIWQTETDADRCFWTQMITGDRSDDIPGLKDVTDKVWNGHGFKGRRGLGIKRATILLEDCKKSLDMEQKVLYLYETYYDSIGGDWQKEFQLNYQLLKLMDQKGVIPKYKF